MPPKGKEVAAKGSKGKRKLDDDKSGGGRKRTNPGVLQFFEDAAEEYDDSSDSDFDAFFDDEFDIQPKVEYESGNTHSLPVFPKEEVMAEEDFDKMMEERYSNARFTYAGDDYEAKRSFERNNVMPFDKEPTIWKVKCTVNRERHSAFCLMQKYVDLKALGTKLQIISAFAVDHLKGHIYVEADRLCDVVEACKGLCSIYSTRVWAVPKNDVSHLLSVRNKCNGVSEGTWARVKNGKYKGDLAQVVAVNDERKRATVKLIPRIDLQALAQKFGSGVPIKRTAIPAPRLITSSELEEFRPLIQYRRDRDTGIIFENLDSLTLKDGYLYKKVSIDSLSCSGVMPTEDELLKFKPSENEQSGDMEWLSQLYGEKKKKRTIKFEKGGGKGEGSSGLALGGSFELYDLVCFGRKDFGLVIGTEKDDSYKILKEGSEGPIVVTLHQNDLKNGLFDAKFTALDKNMKSISINDTVRVLEGPLQGKQGTVKQIYRGTVFLYDENETENGGYFCSKSQMCEKIKLSADPFNDKAGEAGPSGFDGFSSSPKSPLCTKEDPWQARENKRDFNQGDRDGMFSIGQTLRIRVGPLKGYLCRVLAVRRSDITVKLDSQQKVLTVKSEHLCEVRGKSSNISMSEDAEASSLKPFDLLGTQGSSSGWMNAAGTSAEGDGWNSGGPSAERSSWPSFPASGASAQPDSNPFGSAGNDSKTDGEDTAWDSKVTEKQDIPWGTSTAKEEAVANSSQAGGWGKSTDSWNKASSDGGNESSASGWGKAIPSSDPMDSSMGAADNWGKAKLKSGSPAGASDDAAATWQMNDQTGNQSSGWGQATTGKSQQPWGKGKEVEAGFSGNNNEGSGWDTKKSSDRATDVGSGDGSWGKHVESRGKVQDDSWGKASEKWGSKDGPSESNTDWKSSLSKNQQDPWGKGKESGAGFSENNNDDSGWNKKETSDRAKDVVSGDGSWGKLVESRGNVQDDSWGKAADKSASKDGPSESKADSTGWGKGGSSNQDQTDGWNKSNFSGADGGSSWSKPDGGSWKKQDGDSSWGNPKSFDGGHGYGGRSGRGGRDQFGGRSSTGWNREGQESNDSWKKSDAPDEDTGSGWGNKKSSWNSGAGGSQNSDWNKQGSWNSGNASESDNQTDNFGSRAGGGNWRGGYGGGRGGSDGGGFRGRGRGYGGRSGSDGGEFGGRGRSDRGRFGGRGGERGGFGGRGRGRRGDQSGGWSSRNDYGEDKPSWSNGGNNNGGEGWKNNSGGGGGGSSWNQGSGDKANWQGWNSGSGGSKQGGEWNSEGNNSSASGGGWKSSDASGGGEWSSWNKASDSKDVKGTKDEESGWGKGPALGAEGGFEGKSWNKPSAADGGQSSGWNQQKGGAGGATDPWGKGNNGDSLGQPKAGEGGQPWGSGWNQSADGAAGKGGGDGTDPWGKAAGSSWGKGDDGGGKGGW